MSNASYNKQLGRTESPADLAERKARARELLRRKVVAARKAGYTFPQIGRTYGVSHGLISALLKESR